MKIDTLPCALACSFWAVTVLVADKPLYKSEKISGMFSGKRLHFLGKHLGKKMQQAARGRYICQLLRDRQYLQCGRYLLQELGLRGNLPCSL